MTAGGSIIRTFIAPAWARWERSGYLRIHRELLQTQYDSPETIARRQWRQVRSLLDHAYGTTPFWRQRLNDAGLPPTCVQTWDDFARIPVLTKHDLRAHADELVSNAYAKDQLLWRKTSGSTGISVRVALDEDAQQHQRACTLRSDEWSGWRLGERVALLWGNPEYVRRGLRGRLRNTFLERGCYLDTLRMTADSMAAYLQRLRRRPPSLLFGHAHSLHLFARFVAEQGGPGFRPDGIISTAMMLYDHERRNIESVFECLVTNRYGCEEVSLIACQCERHGGMHINSDGVFVELLQEDGSPARPGEPGLVTVTDLRNRAMPLLRYRVGDVATFSEQACPCGRGLPLLERIEGRVADYVVTPTGDLVSGISLTENFAVLVEGLEQVQIIQERLDHIRLRLVRAPSFGEQSLDQIRELLCARLGAGVGFTCEFVDKISPEPTGKYRFCISHVQNPWTGAAGALAS